jgi:hypothetical protein
VKSFGGTGLCIPGYERIAQVACVARVTVERAISRLEAWGLITWDHRIKRVFEAVTDLAGEARRFLRPERSSNSYRFPRLAKEPEAHYEPGTEQTSLFSQPSTPKNESKKCM